ncbi:MAG: acetoacetate decarboxylase family protein [Desulfobacterales bacterium]
MMGFIKTDEEIAKRISRSADFYDAEVLMVYFETRDDVVNRLLPPPLRPSIAPVGGIFVANYPKTNFGVSYLESALFLTAQHNGDEGIFFLAMPVTDDMAMIGGREVFGYPKKMAKIDVKKEGATVKGWTERHGIRFVEIEAQLTGKFNDTAFQQLMLENMAPDSDVVVYNFKHFPAPEGGGFDFNPRLIREIVTRRPKTTEMGKAEITLRSSEHDPWVEVEIVRVLGAVYATGDNTMLPGVVVAEVDQTEFFPYAFMKVDNL